MNCEVVWQSVEQETYSVRKSGEMGEGLFATRLYPKDSIVLTVKPANIFQPIWLINHSCQPNCSLHWLSLVAREAIAAEEEITMDYRQIAFGIQRLDFDCRCGHERCVGHITAGG